MTGTWVVVAPLGAKAEVYGPYAKPDAVGHAERLERAGFAAYAAELRTRRQLNSLADPREPA